MPGIKGMKTKKNHEDSPRFAEYYQKEHPEWTIEQCEEKAKWFKRSCNYQCIEYYEKNYPNLSHDEHLKKECAEYYGYDILYIWEYDYNQNREEVINKCIEFLNS